VSRRPHPPSPRDSRTWRPGSNRGRSNLWGTRAPCSPRRASRTRTSTRPSPCRMPREIRTGAAALDSVGPRRLRPASRRRTCTRCGCSCRDPSTARGTCSLRRRHPARTRSTGTCLRAACRGRSTSDADPRSRRLRPRACSPRPRSRCSRSSGRAGRTPGLRSAAGTCPRCNEPPTSRSRRSTCRQGTRRGPSSHRTNRRRR
jgi:hypothetical protein